MNVNFIHKSERKNLVPDTLSRREELMTILTMSLSKDDSAFEKQVRKTDKMDEEAIEMNKMFNFKCIPKKDCLRSF